VREERTKTNHLVGGIVKDFEIVKRFGSSSAFEYPKHPHHNDEK
jgi:hypothetical protein